MIACRSAIKVHPFVFLTQHKSKHIPTSKTNLKILCYPTVCPKVSFCRTPARIHVCANYSDDAVQNGAYERTVTVMLILNKECQFGEEFCAVGEVESLGSWDPQGAVAMEWNPGHIWTTPPMDLPVGKEICFKFILRDKEGEIEWQPGPDRVFVTCETRGTLLVSLGWDDVDVQTSTEEEEGEGYEEGIAESGVGSVEGAVLVPGLKREAGSGGECESSSIGNDPVIVRLLTTADSGAARESSSIGNDSVLVNVLTSADSGGASEYSSIGNDAVLVPGLTTVMDYGRDSRTEESQNGAHKEREEEEVLSGAENSYAVSDNHISVSDEEETLTISNVAQTSVVVGEEASTSTAMETSVVDGEETSTSTAMETSVVDGEEASTSTAMEDVENQDSAVSSESSCNEGEHSDSVKYPVGNQVLQKDFDWGRNALSKLIWSLGLRDE